MLFVDLSCCCAFLAVLDGIGNKSKVSLCIWVYLSEGALSIHHCNGDASRSMHDECLRDGCRCMSDMSRRNSVPKRGKEWDMFKIGPGVEVMLCV